MRWVWLLVLCSCASPEDQARTWLADHDYTPKSVALIEESAIGPHRCIFGMTPVRAVARRFPVPEENPCLYIETNFILCCPEANPGCRIYSAVSDCGEEER